MTGSVNEMKEANDGKRPAFFLDLYGTVAEEMGYVNHVSRLHIFPGAAEAITRIRAAGYAAVIATNQAGVARGYFPEEVVRQVNEKLKRELSTAGSPVDAVYYCPHHPKVGEPPYRKKCNCRKPNPGMIEQAVRELDLKLDGSVAVGDRYTEIEWAHNLGLQGALVMTGYGRGEYEHFNRTWPRQPDWVAEDLLDAVTKILRKN